MKNFGIEFDSERQIFALQMKDTSYVMGLAGGYLGHLYFGKKINHISDRVAFREKDYSFLEGKPGDKCTFMDGFPFEYGTSGVGDFRVSCLNLANSRGDIACELKYKEHRIYDGKKGISGLPASYGSEAGTKTLEIVLADAAGLCEVTLSYSIFENLNVVARSISITNISNESIYIDKILSSCIELPYKGQDIISLHGSWARERRADRRAIGHGKIAIESTRGISSHQEHPFIALVDKETTESSGDAIGMAFVYSGNFIAEVERTQHDVLRAVLGISPNQFNWKLEPGESFNAPEAVLVESHQGLGEMSRTFHDFIREHIIRSPYLHEQRPILINNWEATYFDFNMDKLLEIARQAKACGIEMLVMDDGWFGKRNSDNSSLGDWTDDLTKLPLGVKGLCEKVNEIGLAMGIWFEPEMISPDSELYRTHPDWALAIDGRDASECRNQFVLDLTRKEVVDYVYECVARVLRETNIQYIKWDMNRPLTDVGSSVTRAGEIHHRYMLAVYELMEKLTAEFPKLLLENCSSGGGRFDMGMLYYSPQIWCSDDTDAMERLSIQEGTALIYPLSAIGAHVSICPNHIVGRTTDFRTRGYVALAGTFGYELDITKLSDEEKEMIREQVADYKKYNHIVREGDYYRITSCSDLVPRYDSEYSYSWMCVTKDKSEALYTYVQERGGANKRPELVKLAGLDPDAEYVLEDGRSFFGDELMNVGFVVDKIYGDGAAQIYYLVEKRAMI